MRWVQLERSSANAVVVTHGVPIPDRSDYVQWALRRDIYRLIPPRVQVAIYDPCLGQAFLILVTEHDIGVAVTANIASLEIFRLNYFDSEDIVIDLLLALSDRGCMALNDSGARIHVDLVLQFVKLGSGKVDVVELHKGLRANVSTARSNFEEYPLTSGKKLNGSIFSLLFQASFASESHFSWVL